MKKIAIALTALAGITFLSGCAYDGYYGDRYASGYGYSPYYNNYNWRGGLRNNCAYDYDAGFCR